MKCDSFFVDVFDGEIFGWSGSCSVLGDIDVGDLVFFVGVLNICLCLLIVFKLIFGCCLGIVMCVIFLGYCFFFYFFFGFCFMEF